MFRGKYYYDQAQSVHSNMLHAFEDSASQDALQSGFGNTVLRQRDLAWMLYRVTMELDDSTVSNEFELCTWPSGHEKLFVYRDYQIVEKGIVRGGGSSTWLLVDTKSKKPIMIREISQMLLQNEHSSKYKRPLSPKGSGDVLCRSAYHIDTSFMDENQHLNNKYFVNFALNELPEDFLLLKEFGAQINKEVQAGDQLTCITEQISDRELIHRLRSENIGDTVAIIYSRWH